MAAELLRRWFSEGRYAVTARELSRASGVPIAQVEDAVLSTASEENTWEMQYTVSFKVDLSLDGDSVPALPSFAVKRFSSRPDAESFAREGSNRKLQLHSISVKGSMPSTLPMCELVARRFSIGKALQRSGSLRSTQDAYPLMTRQATIEKSMSSGDLVPQTLPAVSPVPPSSITNSKANGTSSIPTATPSFTSPTSLPVVTVSPPMEVAVQPPVHHCEVQETAKRVHVDLTNNNSNCSPPDVSGCAPLPEPTAVDTTSSSVATSSVPTSSGDDVKQPLPHGKVQKSLFEMMSIKRPRDLSSGSELAPAAKPPPSSSAKKSVAAPAKAKARQPKETKSLAKLASRKITDGDGAASKSSLFLDTEEQDDSDEERDDDDKQKYLAQVLNTPPPRGPKKNATAINNMSNIILPCEDAPYDDVIQPPQDDIVLGEAASLIRQPAPASTSAKPVQSSPARFAPKTIAPQKRPREVEAPAITGNLDTFFNPDLLAFQQQFTHEHRSDCQVVNGEYVFNDVTYYKHKTSEETLTEEEYHAKQRVLIERFEKERIANKKQQVQLSQESEGGTAAAAPLEAAGKLMNKQKVDTPKANAPKPHSGQQQRTLTSFFTKKAS